MISSALILMTVFIQETSVELAGMEARLVREIQQPGDEIFVQVRFLGSKMTRAALKFLMVIVLRTAVSLLWLGKIEYPSDFG